MHALTDTILLSNQVHVLLLNKKIIKEILNAVITSMLTIDNCFEGDHQGRSQLREIGAAKLKSGGQRFSPKCEGFFWPKSQIFRPKADDLQKKKVFAEIQRLFLAEITNFST